ncbi:unnamed protein product [Closterium sp. NIES-54]
MADAHVDIPPLEEPPVHIPDVSKVQRLAWKPRAFLFPQFLSEAECDYIVNYSRPRMERSTVLSNSGKSVQDSIRTSDGSFIVKYENPVIRRIEERVAAWTFLPIENQEAMQVLRYRDGQEYGAHWDYIDPAKAPTPGGPRYATVLMYLSNVEKGGETAFPESEEDTVLKDDSWSDCGKKGIAANSSPPSPPLPLPPPPTPPLPLPHPCPSQAQKGRRAALLLPPPLTLPFPRPPPIPTTAKPRKGDALLFFSLHPDTSFDRSSLHAGCPVLAGEKWSATKWIHVGSFDLPPRDASVCADDNENCAHWASIGECERNKAYMGLRYLPFDLLPLSHLQQQQQQQQQEQQQQRRQLQFRQGQERSRTSSDLNDPA